LGGCDCGEFDAIAAMPLMTDTCALPDKGVPDVDAVFHLCERPGLGFDERSDFGGAFLRIEGDGCGVAPGACEVVNPRRGDCSCGDALEVPIGVWATCGDENIGTRAPATLTICVDVALPIVTFGGVYRLDDDDGGPPQCAVANPWVPTECACPAGTEPESLRVGLSSGSHGSLVFCMAG
jgi:hypothetical protein